MPIASGVPQWWLVGSDDTTAPGVTIISGPTKSKISRIAGQDVTNLVIRSDEAFVDYQVRVVPDALSPVTAGTLLEDGLPPNPSFETDLTNWSTGSSAGLSQPTFVRSNAWASKGSWSARLTTTGLPSPNNFQQAVSASVGCAAGASLGMLADLNILAITGATTQVEVNFVFATAAFAFNGGANAVLKTASGIYLDAGASGIVAPAGTAFIACTVAANTKGTGGGSVDLHFDNMRIIYPAATNFPISITDDELVAAAAVEGSNILKVFVQDAAGNWSA